MDIEEFKTLKPGDILIEKAGKSCYIIIGDIIIDNSPSDIVAQVIWFTICYADFTSPFGPMTESENYYCDFWKDDFYGNDVGWEVVYREDNIDKNLVPIPNRRLYEV